MAYLPRSLRKKRQASNGRPSNGPILALIGVIITAAAGIIAAEIDHSSPTASASPTVTATPTIGPNRIVAAVNSPSELAITQWSQTPIPPPPSQHLSFQGTYDTNLDASGGYIFVIADASPGTQTPSSWLVSPAADVTAGGHWSVSWSLPNPPKDATWMAVWSSPMDRQIRCLQHRALPVARPLRPRPRACAKPSAN